MNTFLTIISGVGVFIISQYILELILKPYINFRRIIAKIDNKLKYYRNIIWNIKPPINNQNNNIYLPQPWEEAKDEFRKLSCDLETSYKILIIKPCKPSREEISKAIEGLMILSNIIGRDSQYKDYQSKAIELEKEIRECLHIELMNNSG